MSKNEHVTIAVVVLQYRLVEIEEWAIVIFLHTNVQIEAMEDMAGWTSKWREEAKPWLDEQASEEQARQGSSTGVLMQQAGEPSDQLAVSARQTNENVTPKRAQAKQTSERKNSTSERNIRAATRHRQKFVRHRVHRHA